MKRGIFLGSAENIRYVFPEDVYHALLQHCDLPEKVFTREAVLTVPGDFHDVAYIFSTWGMPAFSEEEIALCFPNLRCVFYAAGTVQGFARPFLNRGVQVFSAWAANAVPVAEYTVAQIVLANKGFYQNQQMYKRGDRTSAAAHFKNHPGNYRVRVGLIGAGMIGSMVAQRLWDSKMDVLVFDPFLSDAKAEALRVRKTTLEEIFDSCDVVSNHLANNAQTKNMLGYDLFCRMKPYSTFLNTGRGAQVVETDLAKFLTERPDCTAVLDVTVEEPLPQNHPFFACENCFITTHIAGSAGKEVWRMAEYMLEELQRYETGEPTRYSVTVKMLETMA
ncbi:MAG: hydroxyacid dehydrogenase [Clostridia bacterium]|nr:hydroxyacid dehydrogenase [Clostridia bacterium]